MTSSFDPSGLVKAINPETLRVRPPGMVVFLCGGAIGDVGKPPIALRDCFNRLYSSATPTGYHLILAEKAQPLIADAGYSDLLTFESDIAGAVGLIVLFAESAGSLAELGSFAASDEISPSLLAILDDFYYGEESFIKNGPVKYLENKYGDEWILVLERGELGIASDGNISAINNVRFFSSVNETIEGRLKKRHVLEKFNKNNNGHQILLITGLCQQYGALTITEIEEYLSILSVKTLLRPRIKNLIYCSKLLSWIEEVRKGNHIYYVSTGGSVALEYSAASSVTKDKTRLRGDIRDHWEKHDHPRMRAIREVLARNAGGAHE